MGFTATPLDGSSTPIPMSSAVPDGTNTPLAVEGGPAKSTGGNNLVPVAVYQYDGYDVTQGTSTDANTANSVMGRLTKIRDLLLGTLTVGGSVSVSNFPGTQPVSGTITANQGGSNWSVNTAQVAGTATSVNAGNRDAGTQRVKQAGNGTATITSVTSSAASAQALAANTSKEGTLFYNDSTQICYLLYGAGTASPTNYSVKLASQAYYEDPLHFTGVFTAVWAAANGFLYCTEVS